MGAFNLSDITQNLLPEVQGNIFIHSTDVEFNKGTFTNTSYSSSIGDGAIILSPKDQVYEQNGVYISKEISTVPFQYLVISWNSDTPEKTSIKIEAKVLVRHFDDNGQESEDWTEWLSWGTWGTYIERASAVNNIDDPLAYIDIDTLIIKGSKGETASKIQYRLTLNSQDSSVTPSIRMISGTLRNTLNGQEIVKVCDITNIPENIDLDVPKYSQRLRDPQISGSICSPTSVSMILKYHGIETLPEETAWGVYDKVYDGFGNWPFNTAFVSSFGYESYVEYSTIECLKAEIYNGYPAAVSVKYKNSETVLGNLPVVDGAPIEKTYGHLIVVRGFKKDENGNEYVIVNDPAAASDEAVRLEYKLHQFEAAWNTSGRIAYIIHNKEDGAGYAAPQRLQSQLVPIQNKGKNKREYKLVYNNTDIDISGNYIKTIMVSKDGGKYEYITPSKNNTISLNIKKQKGIFKYLFISKDGKTFEASINL